MVLVVDASVAIGWLVPAQSTAMTRAVLAQVRDEGGLVPAHFGIEVLRGMRRLERRELISSDKVDRVLASMSRMRLRQDARRSVETLGAIISLARRLSLKVDDAGYLELAQRSNLPLATRDAALAEAGRRYSVALFGG